VQWNLRLKAAERGIWKSTQMRRLLAEAGLEISAGKMSALWTGTPTTIRQAASDERSSSVVTPRFGKSRSAPPL
jgi:hypothetical protein